MRVGVIYPCEDPLSPANWSGTPAGLADGLAANGVEVVPIPYDPPVLIRKAVNALSYLGGARGSVASSRLVRIKARDIALRREIRKSGPVDALLAMNNEYYNLGEVAPDGIPVATYDDSTLEQMWGHPDAEIRMWNHPEAEVRKWFARQARSTRAASTCCVSTHFAAKSFIEDYGVDPTRVRVVGMGHRPRVHVAADKRDWSSPRYLFVGVEWERKNGEAVLRAFARVRERHPDATLSLVGIHPEVDAPGVRDYGFLPREDPAAQRVLDELFARSTVFVLPSRFDPAGIAYLEAASAGLPVIATTEGGAGELLGEAASSVHPDDDDALFAAMERLSDPETAARLGKLAAERAAESTWTHVAAKILAALAEAPPRT